MPVVCEYSIGRFSINIPKKEGRSVNLERGPAYYQSGGLLRPVTKSIRVAAEHVLEYTHVHPFGDKTPKFLVGDEINAANLNGKLFGIKRRIRFEK